jgi:hypothetical protein
MPSTAEIVERTAAGGRPPPSNLGGELEFQINGIVSLALQKMGKYS